MLFMLKLALVTGLVAVVTISVRRWGPSVGGWLSAMPVVAGPVIIFYAVEQGTAFAAAAAHATLSGLIATTAFGVAYALASTRLRWYACVAIGWAVFGVATMILLFTRPSLVVSLIGLTAATVAGRRVLPRVVPLVRPVMPPRVDLPVRMAAAAVLVLVLTGLAQRLGPALSGLLNAFPIMTTTIAAFTHAQRGYAAAVVFVNGYLRALPGFSLFCVVLAVGMQPLGVVLALVCALALQLATTALILRADRAARAAAA